MTRARQRRRLQRWGFCTFRGTNAVLELTAFFVCLFVRPGVKIWPLGVGTVFGSEICCGNDLESDERMNL